MKFDTNNKNQQQDAVSKEERLLETHPQMMNGVTSNLTTITFNARKDVRINISSVSTTHVASVCLFNNRFARM